MFCCVIEFRARWGREKESVNRMIESKAGRDRFFPSGAEYCRMAEWSQAGRLTEHVQVHETRDFRVRAKIGSQINESSAAAGRPSRTDTGQPAGDRLRIGCGGRRGRTGGRALPIGAQTG